jgi:hypothetical protein
MTAARSEWDEPERVAMLPARTLDTQIQTEADRLRVRTAAQAIIDAERAGPPPRYDDQFLDGDDLDNLPAPVALLDGVLHRHVNAILRGRDSVWKSFVALDWSLCLATGKSWQGRQTDPVRVLYVAGEGAYGLGPRKRAWEHAWQTRVDPSMFTVRKSALSFFTAGPAFDDLLGRVASGGYGLVVLDTLRRISGGADGNGTDMGVVIDNIEAIKRATTAGSTLIVAHTGKDDNDTRGFSGIEDDIDVVWHAKREQNTLTLTNVKMKDAADGLEITLTPTPSLDSIVLQSHNAQHATVDDLNETDAAVMQIMHATFAETGATVADLVDTSGIPKPTIYRARGRLLAAGHLILTGTKTRPRLELPILTPSETEILTQSHHEEPGNAD